MVRAGLDELKAALADLPKNQAKSAAESWKWIARAADEYARAMAEAPKRPLPPWKVEKELKAIADCARTLQFKLQQVSGAAVGAVEDRAYTQKWRDADPWPWFPIGRYEQDEEGDWCQQIGRAHV